MADLIKLLVQSNSLQEMMLVAHSIDRPLYITRQTDRHIIYRSRLTMYSLYTIVKWLFDTWVY